MYIVSHFHTLLSIFIGESRRSLAAEVLEILILHPYLILVPTRVMTIDRLLKKAFAIAISKSTEQNVCKKLGKTNIRTRSRRVINILRAI